MRLNWLAMVLATVLVWRIPQLQANSGRKTTYEILLAVLCLAIGLGVLGPAGQLPLHGAAFTKPGSAPYTPNVSVGLVAVAVLLLWFHRVETRQCVGLRPLPALRLGWIVGLVTAMFALTVAFALGGIAWQPGLPSAPALLGWVAVQLLVVTAEEAFFRGFLQRKLHAWLGAWYAIPIAALLFGLAHAAGGSVWVIAATVAGIGYGVAYQISGGRLLASISAHLTLNTLHLALWTYPNLPH